MNNKEKCELWLKAGYEYEFNDNSIISDETFDQISRELLRKYNKLPKWFRDQVPEGNLVAGSFAGIVKL